MTNANDKLDQLLDAARNAAPNERINHRNGIAELGAPAIDALTAWLSDPGLSAFAVRTIGKAAEQGARKEAIAALVGYRDRATGATRRDIDWQLDRLGWKPPTVAPRPKDIYEPGSIPPNAGSGWPGFQPHEFGMIKDTIWRSRDGVASLAPLVVRSLQYQHPHFGSYPVERSPMLHFAVSERYKQFGERESGWRAAKLFVYALGPIVESPNQPAEVSAGLYVERGNDEQPSAQGLYFGKVDDSWDWPWLLRGLASPHVQEELGAAMAEEGLSIGDYWHGVDTLGFVGRMEADSLVLRDRYSGDQIGEGWSDLLKRLEARPSNEWSELHIWRSWPKEEVLAGGAAFVEQIMSVLTPLASVYLDFVMPAIDDVRRGWQAVARGEDERGSWVRYRLQAHSHDNGHFNLPAEVARELGIATNGRVHLVIDALGLHWEGTLNTASGTEIYCREKDTETDGLQQIKAGSALTVQVWRA